MKESVQFLPNDESDDFLKGLLSDPGIRKGYIKAALKAGDSPAKIKHILMGLGCYN